MEAYKRRVRPRLSDTGQKIYKATCIIYIEDMHKFGQTYGGLLEYLENLCIPAAVSPIHNLDTFTADDVWKWCEQHIDPETGDLDERYIQEAPYVGKNKKEHVHMFLALPRQATAQEFSELMSGFMDIRASMWEKVMSEKSLLRYFAHMDNPNKAQYSPYDIHSFGGQSLAALDNSIDRESKFNNTTKIMKLIRHSPSIKYFFQLVDIVDNYDDIEMLNTLYGRYGLFNAVIKSRKERESDIKQARANGEEMIG